MPKLYLVGITPDHTGLVLSEHARSKRGDLVLEVDERVVDAVEKAQRLRAREESRGLESAALPTRRDMMTGDGTAGTRLSPREIQQRLRMGETVAGLARASGVDEAWIERFSAPVLAEKARLIERARGLTFHKPKNGPSGVTLGPAVAANVIDKGVALTLPDLEDGWGAFQRPGGEWCVSFSFAFRGRRQVAEWDLDTKKGELVARNKLATDLGYREPGKRLPQPAPAPVAAVVAGTRAPARPPATTVIAPDIPVVEAEEEPPSGEDEAGQDAKASESAAAPSAPADPAAEAAPAAPATPATKGDSTEITIPRGLIMTVRQQPVSTPQTLPGTEVGAEPGARPNGLPPGAAGAVTMAQRPAPAPVTAAAKARAAKTKAAPAPTGTKTAPAPAKAAAAPPPAKTAPAPPPAKAAAAPAEEAPAPPKAAAPTPPAKTPKAAPAPARKSPARAAPKPPPAKAAPAKPATSRRASGRRAKKVAAAPSEPLRSDAPVTPVPPPPPPVPAPRTPEPEAPAESDNPTGPVSLSSRPAPSPVKGRSSRSSSTES